MYIAIVAAVGIWFLQIRLSYLFQLGISSQIMNLVRHLIGLHKFGNSPSEVLYSTI
jgi:hypothetical protein